MQWIELANTQQIEELKEKSKDKPQVIFKHSTRCSISSMAKGRLERSEAPREVDFYHLDLIAHRNLSSKIADEFKVHHESPQVLVIINGECVFDESHYGIDMEDIKQQLTSA
ncbi:MAG TPA: bacillithiol system redox-active protein YtxJ [Segetibacter sp.]